MVGIGGLESSLLELLDEGVSVIIRAFVIGLVHLEHRLNHAGALNGQHIFLAVGLDGALGVILDHIHLDGNLLVETNVAVVEDVAVELEFSGLAEALFHLELGNVAVLGHDAFHLDNVLLGASINDDEVPVRLFQEGVVLRADVGGALITGQVFVLNPDLERDNVTRRDCLLSHGLNFLVH